MTGRATRILAAILLCAVAVVAATRVTQAVEAQPLPAFQVAAADGRVVQSDKLSTEAQWLVIYVTAECPACDRLLDALNSWQLTPSAARVVVIVGGSADKVRPYVLRRVQSNSPAVTMYSDSTDSARQAIAVTTMPTLIGVRTGQIVWSISGVLNDPSAIEGVVRKWLE